MGRALVCALALAPSCALMAGPRRAARGTRGQLSMHTNIYPQFTVSDLAKAKPFMDRCVEATAGEAGCIYYGWTVSEDGTRMMCRETYVDGKAAAAHLAAAVPIVGEMLDSGAVALESIGVMGTEADLADVKAEADKLEAGYWTVWDSFENLKKKSADVAATANFCTIQPTFTIVDLATAEPLMKECVDATKAEKGCVYYGWTIKDDKLFCREAYVDGDAVDAHLANAVPIQGRERVIRRRFDVGCSRSDFQEESIHALSSSREMIARPKMSQNEWKSTEIITRFYKSWDVHTCLTLVPPGAHRRQDARLGLRHARRDRVPRPQGGVAQVQGGRRRARRKVLRRRRVVQPLQARRPASRSARVLRRRGGDGLTAAPARPRSL